jgi:hypothetical protein
LALGHQLAAAKTVPPSEDLQAVLPYWPFPLPAADAPAFGDARTPPPMWLMPPTFININKQHAFNIQPHAAY